MAKETGVTDKLGNTICVGDSVSFHADYNGRPAPFTGAVKQQGNIYYVDGQFTRNGATDQIILDGSENNLRKL